ncbi:Uncharacterised protein [Haemophilus parahaemolyticus]|uniref:Uncharacterized protein n=1 Tax=Haemophilus parahaemolyticus TaxID=735 RepID=A0A377I525_HAEPH|nr:hypothetical protein [Haemophilus parahaemolyticus]STO65057.1 Uncharacterised protein [Haemophilus parahaemolyticus]
MSNQKLISNQEQFLSYLDQVKQIARSVELADNGLTDLTKRIEQAELIVPVVGGLVQEKAP